MSDPTDQPNRPRRPGDPSALFARAPKARRVRGRVRVTFHPFGCDRLAVSFVGEDGTGMLARVLERVTQLEPRANIVYNFAERRFDLGVGAAVFQLPVGNPLENRTAVVALARALRAEFKSGRMPRWQPWVRATCAAAFRAPDRPGHLRALTRVFLKFGINLASVKSKVWPERSDCTDEPAVPFCVLAFDLDLPDESPAFLARLRAAVDKLHRGEFLIGADAVRAFKAARGTAGRSAFD